MDKTEVDLIETYYEQYCSYKSEIMFNYATDSFFDNIESISFCKEVINKIVVEHPIEDAVFEEDLKTEWFSYYNNLINKGHEYYLAYCIQAYKYLRKKKDPFEKYYDIILWVRESNTSTNDQRFFKTDFVRPIIDYILNSYKKESHIIHLIKRYCERIERFREFDNNNIKSERDLQKHFAKYLFDSGHDFYKEVDTCNGQLDFCILNNDEYLSSWQCDDGQYIVEVKMYRDQQQIKNGMVQLSAYLRQCQSHGCLLIYTREELEFVNVPENIVVLTAYVGEKQPSKRTNKISIDFKE